MKKIALMIYLSVFNISLYSQGMLIESLRKVNDNFTLHHSVNQSTTISDNEYWHDYLPYRNCIAVTEAENHIYAATPYALLVFNKLENSVNKITKIGGLSDIGIQTIKYSKDYHTLVIAYSNANIDLMYNNTVTNIQDIKNSPIIGNKIINDIFIIGKLAYLSCGFGIVVLDIENKEILNTIYIGANGLQVNVLGLTKDNSDTLYAATASGIFLANANDPEIGNYESWKKDSRIDINGFFNTISFFSGEVVVNMRCFNRSCDTLYRFSNSRWNKWVIDVSNPIMKMQSANNTLSISFNNSIRIYSPDFSTFTLISSYLSEASFPQDALVDKDSIAWFCDRYSGLISYSLVSNDMNMINPGGPLTASVFSLGTSNNDLYVAPGGINESFEKSFIKGQIYHFDHGFWNNVSEVNDTAMNQIYDVVDIAIDPNDSKHIFAGTFGNGLLELENDVVINRFTEENSTLRHIVSSDISDIRVGGTAFDAFGNLWVVCSHTNYCLSKKTGNTWIGYNISIINNSDLGELLIDTENQKWVLMRYTDQNPNSILVYSDKGTDATADDEVKILNSAIGSGSLPGNNVRAFAMDIDGKIWIGTENGVAVFNSPELVFSGQNFDCQRPVSEQGGYLLENETVTAIAIDGLNRKWFGTSLGGVYLYSQDGTNQLCHFTAENSPLFSNHINTITINTSGELFIGTDKGIISNTQQNLGITPPSEMRDLIDLQVYPNPVNDKMILEFWLAYSTDVEISYVDLTGRKIYQDSFKGIFGSNIKTIDLKSSSSGIYLIKLRIGKQSISRRIMKL
jgi:hypothetical protein